MVDENALTTTVSVKAVRGIDIAAPVVTFCLKHPVFGDVDIEQPVDTTQLGTGEIQTVVREAHSLLQHRMHEAALFLQRKLQG